MYCIWKWKFRFAFTPGGVTSMDSFLKKFFPSVYWKERRETSTDQYCKFDSHLLTAFTSSLYLAAFVASFFVPIVTRRHGRKVSILFGSAVFLCGAILNGVAQNVVMLILGRILLGVGVGFTNHVISSDFSNFLLLLLFFSFLAFSWTEFEIVSCN